MNIDTSSELSGKEHFRLLYQTELEQEAEWLRRGAVEKVNSIDILLRRNKIKPKTLLELGCGVGAVLTECQHRNLANRYIGVDYAPEAIDYLRKHSSGIETLIGDISDPAFCVSDIIDTIIVSHVLEHLETPASFLINMKKTLRFSHAIIEVPLEGLTGSKLKSILKDRTANKAGHVQFFTVRTFEDLLRSNGFRIIDRRSYLPILDMETLRFVSEKNGLARHQLLFKVLTNHLLPIILKPFWKRLYYAHHAVLCVVDY